MQYLACTVEGYLRKFVLNQPIMTLGRSEDSDIVINDKSVSRHHLTIELKPDKRIYICDHDTSNGTYVNRQRIKNAFIQVGESFFTGEVRLEHREGEEKEFTLSREIFSLEPETIPGSRKISVSESITDVKQIFYREFIKKILAESIKFRKMSRLMVYLNKMMRDLAHFGSLFLVAEGKGENILHLSITRQKIPYNFKRISEEIPDLFSVSYAYRKFPAARAPFYSIPLTVNKNAAFLIYILNNDPGKRDPEVERFIKSLASTIELVEQLYHERKSRPGDPGRENLERKPRITAVGPVMKNLVEKINRIARSDIFLLLLGESGTGKELFARTIHEFSPRKTGRFVALNCAAIPDNLLESELFGHEKGAFTGAHKTKIGKLELASRGTLVFDEIGDMPLNLQSKLLRALQENEFYRLGGTEPIKVDLRIISLTNKNLYRQVEQKKFREDLFYRIVHRTLEIPPLRERREDIPELINIFTREECEKQKKMVKGYTVKAFELLLNHEWKGNVRQLKNEIRSIVNLTMDGDIIDHEIISAMVKSEPEDVKPDQVEQQSLPFYQKPDREYILELLEKNNWNKSKTARDLNLTYLGLHKKLKKMGIQNLPPSGKTEPG